MKNKKINICIVLLLTILVLYLSLKDDYKAILSLLMDAKLIWLIMAYLFVLAYTFLKSIVTHELITSLKPDAFNKTFKLQIMTFFFNAVTPFSSGGQPFQAYVLKKNGMSLTHATNVVVQESMIHQLSLALVIIISVILNYFFNIYKMDHTLIFFVSLGFLINFIVAMLLLFLAYNKKTSKKILSFIINLLSKIKLVKNGEYHINRWNNRIDDFTSASKMLLTNKTKFICMIFINTIAIMCLHATPFLILFSLGDYNAFNGVTAIVLVSFISIISSFVPLPGGSLGQEYLFALFFSAYISNPLLSSVMILWRLITYYVPMIVGALTFNIQNKLNN